jgi:uncharacterized membrane protein YqjE
MEGSEQPSTSWTGAVRSLGTTLLRLLHTRLELFAIELKEEKTRLVSLLVWTGAVLFFCIMTAVCSTAAAVLFCPPGARAYVLAGFCAGYAGMALGFGWKLRRELRQGSPPLASTVDELKKDVEWLRSKT